MCFIIFQFEDMLYLCLNVNKSQHIYAYNGYAYIKNTVAMKGLLRSFKKSVGRTIDTFGSNKEILSHEKAEL